MDIEYVARLARLKLSPEEKERFAKQLGDILLYVEKLNQLDTKGVEPTAHILPMRNVWRSDSAQISLDYNLLKRIMPDEHEGFFKVPPVIE